MVLKITAATEETPHWQRHCHHHIPGTWLGALLSQDHPLSLPAHLCGGQGGKPQHTLHGVQVGGGGGCGRQVAKVEGPCSQFTTLIACLRIH